MHGMLPVPPEVEARERERRSSAGGPWRRMFSSGNAGGLLDCGMVVILLAFFVCGVLSEVLDGIGWGHAADVVAGLLSLLAFFGSPALLVYIVVKVRRGEMHW